MKKRIAILFHENEKKFKRGYVITYFADIWREEGNEVIFLFGTKKFIPADLIIVHVNLSVVPDTYLGFARKYPLALNGEIKDVRKSTFSKNLIRSADSYNGKVIVKSNLNFAGRPERKLLYPSYPKRFLRLLVSWLYCKTTRTPYFNSCLDYRLYDHPRLVPRSYFKNQNLVVEKFLPEMENGFYVVRNFHFLGDRMICNQLVSKHPIVKGATHIKNEKIEPDPEIIGLRKAMKFDYGKFDYVLYGGQVVLLDINKTTGFGSLPYTSELKAMHRYRAAGIYSYF
jgi:hypothetical protein